MQIPIDLENEIIKYCEVNSINDIEKFKLKLLKQGFTAEKYGLVPVVEKKIEQPKQEEPIADTGTTKITRIEIKTDGDIYGEG